MIIMNENRKLWIMDEGIKVSAKRKRAYQFNDFLILKMIDFTVKVAMVLYHLTTNEY